MRSRTVVGFLVPLLMLVCIGLTIRVLSPYVDTTTRWLMVLALVASVVIQKRAFEWVTGVFGAILLFYLVWCLATGFWSEVPQLTVMKSAAFLVVALGLTAAGYQWARLKPLQSQLGYLYPLAAVALVATLLGYGMPGTTIISGQTHMYQGAVVGPNMFGMLMAMIGIAFIWGLYSYWDKPAMRVLFILLLGITVFFLFSSRSRNAMLVLFFATAGLLVVVKLDRRQKAMFVVTGLLSFSAIIALTDSRVLITHYIYKSTDRSLGVFYTREEVWSESYKRAKIGGAVGAGYGVTIGDREFGGGFTSVGYGREKGNSQLAILEETGVVGLVFFFLLIFSLAGRLTNAYFREKRGHRKVFIGYLGGCLAGMMASSIFEAWWVSPGAPESVFFWVLVGIIVWHSSGRARHSKPVGSDRVRLGYRPPLQTTAEAPAISS